ncbi:glutathione S-transferase family protein [Variovorax sp. PAMC 28711]|uniref:glutathione S-transferase family protein n=1 Tax=Variovorax sp. PAMC 28711 TaxID=1795631 RepID=UPI00078C26A6|nr:glutathione S-transferase [Variovorax sp. PAMC 28711]AMM23415.1 glutathione S-transferase [Variovorax sp. PAMC 28711]
MLTLIGFAASNYYNKVKLALLEKGVRFDEELAWVGETDLTASPLGKVPYLRTTEGTLCESSAINEYIEAAYPEVPLLPADPFAAAKVRELVLYLELHLELVVRNVYSEAFFGGKVSDGLKQMIGKQLTKNIAAFGKLARFDTPFIAGDQLTLADCAAVCHLPVLASATKIIYGEDMLAAQLPAARDYLKRLNARPHVQAVNAERKLNTEQMLARY